jgi:hypothetical protein
MEPLQIGQKQPAQITDFAGREANSKVVFQAGLDLFSLTMMDETLQAHEDDDIVADLMPIRDASGQAGAAMNSVAAIGVVTSGSAYINRLHRAKPSVF